LHFVGKLVSLLIAALLLLHHRFKQQTSGNENTF